jgi:hypothetical protein
LNRLSSVCGAWFASDRAWRAQLLTDLQRLQLRRFFGQIGIHQRTEALVQGVDPVAVELDLIGDVGDLRANGVQLGADRVRMTDEIPSLGKRGYCHGGRGCRQKGKRGVQP